VSLFSQVTPAGGAFFCAALLSWVGAAADARSELASLDTAGASVTVAAGVPGADIVGEAFDVRTGDLLYREVHDCSEDGTRCIVDYRDVAGQAIAFKELDYSVSRYAPGLVMRDLRGGTEHVLPGADAGELVVDAGFDNFVRSRWEELERGETVTFPFQVVGFDRPFAMKARAVDAADCDAQSLCLSVEIDSWLLGLVADPIELAYARDSRRLLRFVGVSNLRDTDGKSPKVDIRYRYDETGEIIERGQ
jgi:hypothetical protein